MSSRVAIVIVTYNGQQYVEELFASLAEDTYPKDRLGIIVVDNASRDKTVARISNDKFLMSNVVVIRNEQNEGFAAGNNLAIRRALEEGYDWVMLLNQDTVVKPGYLEELLRVGNSDPRIAAVQPLLALWPPERGEINSLGNEIHFLGFGFSRGYHEKMHKKVHLEAKLPSEEIAYGSGAAVLYRAAALRDVGLFNESFFMYHEDLDLGWRLWLRNWKSVLAPGATVYHKYDFRAAPYKYYYMERNRLIVLLQNYKLPTLVLISPALILMELGVFAFSIIKGWWAEKLRGYWWVLVHLPSILKQRAAIQQSRLVSDRELTHHFVGTIEYQEISNPLLRIANPFFLFSWRFCRWFLF